MKDRKKTPEDTLSAYATDTDEENQPRKTYSRSSLYSGESPMNEGPQEAAIRFPNVRQGTAATSRKRLYRETGPLGTRSTATTLPIPLHPRTPSPSGIKKTPEDTLFG